MTEAFERVGALRRSWWLWAIALAAVGWLVSWLVWPASWRFQLFCAVVPVALVTGWRLRGRLSESPVCALWFFNVFAGILLLAYVPPIASVAWDGQTHFSAALAISQGGDATYNGADLIMADRDGIYEVGLIPFGTSDDDWHPNWRLSLSEAGLARQVEVLEEAAASAEPVTTHGFSRIGDDGEVSLGFGMGTIARLPMAAGLWLGRALGLPLLWTYALGRIANYALWCALTWLAMRRLVSGRWLFLAICLIPTNLFIACNWSYDPWVVGFAAIATTSLLGELQRPDRPLTVGGALWMLIPYWLATGVKAILFPWAIAFLFLPARKFPGRGARWAWWGAWAAVMALLVVGFMAPFLSSHGASNVDTQAVSAVSPWEQLRLMAREPWHYGIGLALTTVDYVNPVRILFDLPMNLCYLPRPWIWAIIAIVELGGLAWLALADRSEADAWAGTREGRRLRLGALAGFIIAFGALLTALYVSYNEVGSNYILGMQARYYLMFLPLVLGVMLDGDGWRGVARICTHLPASWQRGLALTGDAAMDTAAIEAYPHGWWLCRSLRSRQALIAGEAILLLCLVLFGFVVWFF